MCRLGSTKACGRGERADVEIARGWPVLVDPDGAPAMIAQNHAGMSPRFDLPGTRPRTDTLRRRGPY